MAEQTKIQWADHTKVPRKDVRSLNRIWAAGFSWCTQCRSYLTHDYFGKDSSRWNGLDTKCIVCRAGRNRIGRLARVDVPRRRGRRFASPRNGDKVQARGRANHLMRLGLVPAPNDVPCSECGHIGGDRRHELHHHLGYGGVHHDDVIVLCSACHHLADRNVENRSRNRLGQFERRCSHG